MNRRAVPARTLSEMALQWLKTIGAVRTDGHFVYTSGKHGPDYVSKELVASQPALLAELGHLLAEVIGASTETIEVVVAPAVGAITLGHEAAIGLSHQYSITRGREPVRFAYAEKSGDGFVLRPIFREIVRGKRVAIVEDILTTGSSAAAVVEAVRQSGGEIVIVGALLNRGGVSSEQLDVSTIVSLIDFSLEQYAANDCPLCKEGRPVNTDFGHGAEFLARRSGASETT